jgi:cytochrome c2
MRIHFEFPGDFFRGSKAVIPLVPLVATMILTAGVSFAEPPKELGDPMLGKELLTSKGCMTCHSIWGAGGDLGPDFARVSSNKNLPEILGDFWNHTPKMIETALTEGLSWPSFTLDEMENVISYLYYLNIFDNPGDPEAGSITFHRKACDYCHSVGTIGTNRVKSLDHYARYITPTPLAQAMWNKGPAMTRMQKELGIEMPWFEGREMADLQAFIRRYGDRKGEPTRFRQPPNPFRGETLFKEKQCGRCHPVSRDSSSGVPPLEMVAFKKTLSEISGILWNHSYRMQGRMDALGIRFPIFKETEMADLIAFLYYFHFYREVGEVENGRKMFNQKGCVSCHEVSEVAVRVKPRDSDEIKDYYIGFATAMWNHAPTMQEMLRQKKVQWPKFYGKEMLDLVTFIYREGGEGDSN